MEQEIKKARKKLSGKVVHITSDVTLKVKVERKMVHPLYKKIIKRHKTFTVNNTGIEVKVGDDVMIEECRPISKRKSFNLIKINK
jgi:small subunit ribosomal protein S17